MELNRFTLRVGEGLTSARVASAISGYLLGHKDSRFKPKRVRDEIGFKWLLDPEGKFTLRELDGDELLLSGGNSEIEKDKLRAIAGVYLNVVLGATSVLSANESNRAE